MGHGEGERLPDRVAGLVFPTVVHGRGSGRKLMAVGIAVLPAAIAHEATVGRFQRELRLDDQRRCGAAVLGADKFDHCLAEPPAVYLALHALAFQLLGLGHDALGVDAVQLMLQGLLLVFHLFDLAEHILHASAVLELLLRFLCALLHLLVQQLLGL